MRSDSTVFRRRLRASVAETGGTLVDAAPVGLLWASLLASGGLGFAAEVLFARQLSLSEYGSLATALTAILLISPIAGAGVGPFLLSRAGEEGGFARRWLGPVLRTTFSATGLAAALVAGWAISTSLGSLERQLLLILVPTLVLFSQAEIAHGIFQLERRHSSLALLGVAPYAGRFAVAALATILGLGALGISLALLAMGVMLALAIAAAVLRRLRDGFQISCANSPETGRASTIRTSVHGREQQAEAASTPAVVADAWPYAIAGIMALLHSRADVVVFGWLLGPEEAGLLQVSLAIMAVVFYLPAAVYGKYLLPLYHTWAARDRTALASAHRLWTRRMGVAGLLAAGLVAVGTPWLVPWLFGPAFQQTVPLLMILAPWIPLRFASAGWETLLGTRRWIRLRVKLQLLGGAAHLLLTVSLLPLLGLYAAVASTISSELLLLILYRRAYTRALQGAQ